MILQHYNNCFFCGSSHLELTNNQEFKHTFYTKCIKSDLGISDKIFKKMKVYSCKNCNILQNNPWFKEEISFKIFNEIYGQHNRNWLNVLNFFKKGIKPYHGNLFDILNNSLKIKNYCEFNAPFVGLFLNYFNAEYINKSKFFNKIFNYSLKYLSSRQIANYKSQTQIKKQLEAEQYLEKLKKLKQKNNLKKIVKKTLIIDNSFLGWLYNDNYKSVNSRALASNLLDIKIKNFNLIKKSEKYDLFGIFNTLDHSYQPKKILDFALNNSKYVLIYGHSDENLEKQHLFSLSNKFINYLVKNKISCKDLTQNIDKKFKSKEIYILCSKFNKINLKF